MVLRAAIRDEYISFVMCAGLANRKE